MAKKTSKKKVEETLIVKVESKKKSWSEELQNSNSVKTK
jgi:hypothetical protein